MNKFLITIKRLPAAKPEEITEFIDVYLKGFNAYPEANAASRYFLITLTAMRLGYYATNYEPKKKFFRVLSQFSNGNETFWNYFQPHGSDATMTVGGLLMSYLNGSLGQTWITKEITVNPAKEKKAWECTQ